MAVHTRKSTTARSCCCERTPFTGLSGRARSTYTFRLSVGDNSAYPTMTGRTFASGQLPLCEAFCFWLMARESHPPKNTCHPDDGTTALTLASGSIIDKPIANACKPCDLK